MAQRPKDDEARPATFAEENPGRAGSRRPCPEGNGRVTF